MSGDYRGQSFEHATFAGARFRAVDFSAVKMVDAMLANADLSGMIEGLRINGIEVAPLIDAEIRRLYPELDTVLVRDLEALSTSWATVCARWDATIDRANAMAPGSWSRQVDGEWSLADTVRHLVFVIDAWVRRVVLGDPQPYHPLALPPSFVTDLRLGVGVQPSPAEVVAAYRERVALVDGWLDQLTPEDLDRTCSPPDVTGYPPAGEYALINSIRTLLEEWFWHRMFAERDLDVIAAATGRTK